MQIFLNMQYDLRPFRCYWEFAWLSYFQILSQPWLMFLSTTFVLVLYLILNIWVHNWLYFFVLFKIWCMRLLKLKCYYCFDDLSLSTLHSYCCMFNDKKMSSILLPAKFLRLFYENISYNIVTTSLAYCLFWKYLSNQPSFLYNLNDLTFSKFNHLSQSWKRWEFQPTVKSLYPLLFLYFIISFISANFLTYSIDSIGGITNDLNLGLV